MRVAVNGMPLVLGAWGRLAIRIRPGTPHDPDTARRAIAGCAVADASARDGDNPELDRKGVADRVG